MTISLGTCKNIQVRIKEKEKEKVELYCSLDIL
jgi:hypothetical protein